jgi:hypothetical protein
MSWRGRARTSNLLIQSQAFCRLNYPPRPVDNEPARLTRLSHDLLSAARRRLGRDQYRLRPASALGAKSVPATSAVDDRHIRERAPP